MASELFILDLDRTAFDTHRFSRDLIALVMQQFGLSDETFRAGMKQYAHPGELGYDFYGHIHAATGQSTDEIDRLIATHLGDQDYLFPDVDPWIEQRHRAKQPVIVVTVGVTDYQSLKIRHAKQLSNLPAMVVHENKGRLLRTGSLDLSKFDYEAITIIDDNPITFTELGEQPATTQVYISRLGQKYAGQPVPAHVRTIASFGELL